MGRHPNPHRDCLPPNLVQGVRKPLHLIVVRSACGPLTHVALPQRGTERLQKIAGESDVIGNRLRYLIRVDEIRRLPLRAVRAVDERHSCVIEHFFEHHRIFSILLDVVWIRLDALQAERLDSFYRPGDIVLPSPNRARGAEQNVRVDRIERLVGHRREHLRWSKHADRRSHRGEGSGRRHELASIHHDNPFIQSGWPEGQHYVRVVRNADLGRPVPRRT
jgi:hypothetical protein